MNLLDFFSGALRRFFTRSLIGPWLVGGVLVISAMYMWHGLTVL